MGFIVIGPLIILAVIVVSLFAASEFAKRDGASFRVIGLLVVSVACTVLLLSFFH